MNWWWINTDETIKIFFHGTQRFEVSSQEEADSIIERMTSSDVKYVISYEDGYLNESNIKTSLKNSVKFDSFKEALKYAKLCSVNMLPKLKVEKILIKMEICK